MFPRLLVTFYGFIALLRPCALYSADPPPPHPEIKALEDAIIASRASIVAGQVKVKLTSFRGDGSPPMSQSIGIFFDGVKYRADRLTADETVVSIQCFGERQFFEWMNTPSSSHGASVLKVVDLALQDQRVITRWDIRKLMMHASIFGVSHAYPLTGLLARPGNRDFVLAKEDFAGAPVVKVAYTLSNGTRLTYWVSPAQSHNILRMLADGNGVLDSVECTLQQLPSGIWFPKTIRQRRMHKGIESGEDLVVNVVSLGAPLDPACFTPVGMGVPVGTLINRKPEDSRGSLKWDGKEMVPVTAQEHAQRLNPGESPAKVARQDRQQWLSIASISIAIFATCLFVWRRGAKSVTLDKK